MGSLVPSTHALEDGDIQDHPAKRQCSVDISQILPSPPTDTTSSSSPSTSSPSHPASTAATTPPTPFPTEPSSSSGLSSSDPAADALAHATHILSTEALALAHVSQLYATSPSARSSLLSAIQTIAASQRQRGKLIVSAVGKSGYVARKFVATCKSLGVGASFLHAGEGVHGDLGDVREHDTLLLLSNSGATPELLSLLPHLPARTPLIALTSHTTPSACPLLDPRNRRSHPITRQAYTPPHPELPGTPDYPAGILLPAPLPQPELESLGLRAPTASTTVALAVSDMLALSVARELHHRRAGGVAGVFGRNHPGGAIGMAPVNAMGGEVSKGGQGLGLLSPELSGSDEG